MELGNGLFPTKGNALEAGLATDDAKLATR